jgi:integrase
MPIIEPHPAEPLCPSSGQVTYWDVGSPLGLRVSQGGSKTFIVLIGSGKRKTIGRYPTISLQQARDAARRIVAEKTLGIVHKQSISFDDAVSLFLSSCQQRNKPRTVADYRAHIKRHFKFGARRLSDITTDDISNIIDRLKATPTEQNHAHTTLSILLKWAVRRGYIERSPMERLQLPARLKPRSRILSDDELRAVYLAANSPVFGSIVRLCILLGQRRSEIGSLRWDWIDREARTIAFPAEVIKNNRVHVIPYERMAEEIFASIPVLSDHLFPGRDGNATFQGWSKSKHVLDLNSGVKEWTLHDLRRVFSTRVAAYAQPHVLERILNHSAGQISGVARIYNQFQYMAEMREALQKWESHLSTILRHRIDGEPAAKGLTCTMDG